MAVRINTSTGSITCQGKDLGQVISDLEALEKEGKHYYCCGDPESGCVRIDQITTIQPTRRADGDGDEEGSTGGDQEQAARS